MSFFKILYEVYKEYKTLKSYSMTIFYIGGIIGGWLASVSQSVKLIGYPLAILIGCSLGIWSSIGIIILAKIIYNFFKKDKSFSSFKFNYYNKEYAKKFNINADIRPFNCDDLFTWENFNAIQPFQLPGSRQYWSSDHQYPPNPSVAIMIAFKMIIQRKLQVTLKPIDEATGDSALLASIKLGGKQDDMYCVVELMAGGNQFPFDKTFELKFFDTYNLPR